jgi:hypothetical protein
MAEDDSFALIYSASDATYQVNLSKLSGYTISGAWYNPRNNKYKTESSFIVTDKTKIQKIDPPGDLGAGNDWVLIVGDKMIIDDLNK